MRNRHQEWPKFLRAIDDVTPPQKQIHLIADNYATHKHARGIDEASSEAYKQARSKSTSRRKRAFSAGSVNRELATLRRLLRLAHEWKVIQRVPRVHLLRGERQREFVLSRAMEMPYLDMVPAPLADAALLLLDTGLRLGEALSLEWPQVRLDPANGAKFGFLTVLSGKAKNRKSRNVPLSERAAAMLRQWGPRESGLVFRQGDGGTPLSESRLDQRDARVRDLLKLPTDFVLHSLRHAFGARLGEAGADAFTIMRLTGHSTVTVSQRYVHPSPEAVELAYGRLLGLNLQEAAEVSAPVPTAHAEIVQ